MFGQSSKSLRAVNFKLSYLPPHSYYLLFFKIKHYFFLPSSRYKNLEPSDFSVDHSILLLYLIVIHAKSGVSVARHTLIYSIPLSLIIANLFWTSLHRHIHFLLIPILTSSYLTFSDDWTIFLVGSLQDTSTIWHFLIVFYFLHLIQS